MTQIVLNIPDNEVVSFIEMTKNLNYHIEFEKDCNYPPEFIEMLKERDQSPREKFKSARLILENLAQKYDV